MRRLLFGGIVFQGIPLDKLGHAVVCGGIFRHAQQLLELFDIALPIIRKGIGGAVADGKGVVPILPGFFQQVGEGKDDLVLLILLFRVLSPWKEGVVKHHGIAGPIDRDGIEIPIQNLAPGGSDGQFRCGVASGQIGVFPTVHNLDLKQPQAKQKEDKHDYRRGGDHPAADGLIERMDHGDSFLLTAGKVIPACVECGR